MVLVLGLFRRSRGVPAYYDDAFPATPASGAALLPAYRRATDAGTLLPAYRRAA